MKRIFACVTTIVCFAFILSCKKHSDATPKSCRIVGSYDTVYGVGSYFTDSEQIVYNNDGKISHFVSFNGGTPFSRVFTYGPNYILAYPGSNQTSTDTVVLADSNRVARIIEYEPPYGSSRTEFTYDAAGQLQTEKFYNIGSPTPDYTLTYTWANGDITGIQNDNGSRTTCTYYPDKLSGDGDFYAHRDIISYGVAIHRSKHLLKSRTTDGNVVNVSYKLDKEGKILAVSLSAGAFFETTAYIYDCQ